MSINIFRNQGGINDLEDNGYKSNFIEENIQKELENFNRISNLASEKLSQVKNLCILFYFFI